ncbi:hypothetical protein GCM10012288_22900 [Malaciobacter pacificus]|jgi:hypothetical protein|uniref:Uncharacterized protein n=1 Tax=Malaciobacter pacificus TaxID=1080223 RepID=A0A5C2HDF4_9BACT|nr:DUF6726 family protein [Malaciobacter pacificus]QEP34864.1 hypothetical protein APAC_1777 [Malaciobacter pacificus]GGD48080.1 hypothetical protein GCM10012288_22900 [Malaciobacter pacificus]
MSLLLKSIFILLITFLFQGCIVGTVVAAPFKVAGAVVNTVTPDIVGDTISATGDVVDMVIPF